MISLTHLRALIEANWSHGFAAVPTSYAGSGFDDDARAAWAELWVTSGDARRRRSGGPDRTDVTVTVHLFVRDASQPRLAEDLVDAARVVLDQSTWTSDVLRVQLREFTVRDLSRTTSPDKPRVLRHVVVIARGVAEEICPVVVA